MSRTGRLLMEMYQAMLARFGHQQWWPGETPLEVCIGAILTQNTSWRNVEKAIANLKAAGVCSVEGLHRLPMPAMAELIKPAGYYNIKAKRLKNFIRHLAEHWDGELGRFFDRPLPALREDLLGINGIGRETADSICLYAGGKCTFVVDAYTARILLRHGLIDIDYDYDMIKELMESNLPADADLFNDYHAQFVAVGKEYCRPTARCQGCPLEPFEHDPMAGKDF